MKPADDEASAAETWTIEDIALPNRVPMRVEQECNGSVKRALDDRALLLKKKNRTKQPKNKEQPQKEKQNKAATDKDQRKADCSH